MNRASFLAGIIPPFICRGQVYKVRGGETNLKHYCVVSSVEKFWVKAWSFSEYDDAEYNDDKKFTTARYILGHEPETGMTRFSREMFPIYKYITQINEIPSADK